MSRQRAALVVAENGWGALEWIAPAICSLQEQESIQVLVYFPWRWARQQSSRYFDLSQLLQRHHFELLDPVQLLNDGSLSARYRASWRIFRHESRSARTTGKAVASLARRLIQVPFRQPLVRADKLFPCDVFDQAFVEALQPYDVRYLFHDHGAQDPAIYYQVCPEARVFIYPHGTNWLNDRRSDTSAQQKEYHAVWTRSLPRDAVIFTGTAGDEVFYRKLGVANPVHACGIPRFDRDWHARQLQRDASGRREAGTEQPAGKRLLFISMPAGKFSHQSDFDRHMHALLDAVHLQRWHLVIKPHPRQKTSEIESHLKRFPQISFEWCNQSATTAARQVDAVVTFPSSAAMDAVASGAPVLEFFDFQGQNYASFVDHDGKRTSIYRKSGLVAAADDRAELDHWLRQCSLGAGPAIAETQYAALQRLLDGKTAAVSEILDVCLGSRRREAA